MPLKPLVTAGVENLLNTFLYRSPALKSARTRLQGKVLRVDLKGFSTSLVTVFSERSRCAGGVGRRSRLHRNHICQCVTEIA